MQVIISADYCPDHIFLHPYLPEHSKKEGIENYSIIMEPVPLFFKSYLFYQLIISLDSTILFPSN